MADRASALRKVLFTIYMVILHAVVIGFLIERFLLPSGFLPTAGIDEASVPQLSAGPQVTPAVLPTELPHSTAEPSAIPTPFPTIARGLKVVIPVKGVAPERLIDTFAERGRVLDGIGS